MFTHARQRYRASLGLLAAALLSAGCASLDTTTENLEATEAPNSSSFDAESGQDSAATATPATFDRNDPNFQFFNICEELTNEDLAEVGLIMDDQNPVVDLSIPISNCGFSELGGFDTEAYGIQYAVMSMGALADHQFSQQVEFYEGFDETVLPGIRYFSPEGELSDKTCDAAVPTANGRLWVTYGTVRQGAMTHNEICSKAADLLARIHSVMEDQK